LQGDYGSFDKNNVSMPVFFDLTTLILQRSSPSNFLIRKKGEEIMSSLRSPGTSKNLIDRKFKNDRLPKSSSMNNELKFPPIPENSRANQLIHNFRELNQFMPYSKDAG